MPRCQRLFKNFGLVNDFFENAKLYDQITLIDLRRFASFSMLEPPNVILKSYGSGANVYKNVLIS